MCQDSPKNGSHLFSQIKGKHHGQAFRHLVKGRQRFCGVCPCCMDFPATPSQNSVKMINAFLQGGEEGGSFCSESLELSLSSESLEATTDSALSDSVSISWAATCITSAGTFVRSAACASWLTRCSWWAPSPIRSASAPVMCSSGKSSSSRKPKRVRASLRTHI